MTDIKTEHVTLSITTETAQMLRAFTAARNGSIDNQADAAIREGINTLLATGQHTLRERYHANLLAEKGGLFSD